MQSTIYSKMLTDNLIDEVARQSARHFLLCFEQDGLDVHEIIEMLAQCCREHKELAIHIGLLHYCKLYRRSFPEHYIEIADDNDAYDIYCEKLTANLIDFIRS